MTANRQFRNTSWGNTIDEVRAAEVSASYIVEDEDSLSYSGSIVGSDAVITYFFKNNELVYGAYSINTDNDINDLSTYLSFKELLVKKYGEPDTTDFVQKYPNKSITLNITSDYIKAISAGLLKLKSIWKTDESIIILECAEDKEEYKINVTAMYMSANTTEIKQDYSYEEDLDYI